MSWWTKYTEVQVELAIANALAGGGPGTPSAPDTSIQFNNGGAFGGSADLTWVNGYLSLPHLLSTFNASGAANTDPTIASYKNIMITSGTGGLGKVADLYGSITGDATHGSSEGGALAAAIDSFVDRDNGGDLYGGYIQANVFGAGDSSSVTGIRASASNVGSGTIDEATGITTAVFSAGSGTITNAWANYAYFNNSAGTVENAFIYYGLRIGNPATNTYWQWFDSQGVFRIREDNTFDSVYQAIAALYNPQYPKYTAGAQAYERIILGQFNGNVAEIGTEKGPTQTLTSVTSVGTTATATKTNHGYRTGDTVTIAGSNQAEYNGAYTVTKLTDNTFSYTFAGSATTPATGTITSQAGTLRKVRLIGGGLLLDSTILPTSNPGPGQLWNDGNTVKVGT